MSPRCLRGSADQPWWAPLRYISCVSCLTTIIPLRISSRWSRFLASRTQVLAALVPPLCFLPLAGRGGSWRTSRLSRWAEPEDYEAGEASEEPSERRGTALCDPAAPGGGAKRPPRWWRSSRQGPGVETAWCGEVEETQDALTKLRRPSLSAPMELSGSQEDDARGASLRSRDRRC